MILKPGDHERSLTWEGRSRSYLVHVPPECDPGRPRPVVLALHGATSNAWLMRDFIGLNAAADLNDFLAVYPNGTGNVASVLIWNGGNPYGYAFKNNVDDVGFINTLLEDLANIVPVDQSRIYATGMSNGAQMVYRLASELTDRFAAIAAVAGPMGLDACHPSRPIPVLHIHGTEDEFAPYHGGIGPKSVYGANFQSVAQTIRSWVRANHCLETSITQTLPTLVDDGTRIIRQFYPPRDAGAPVELLTVEGGGHTWPGRPPVPPRLGKSTQNLDANQTIWDFFKQYAI